jgi:hypothetical protein
MRVPTETIDRGGQLHMRAGSRVALNLRTMFAASLATMVGAFLALAFFAGSAEAYVGIDSFTMEPSSTQAGGHPDVRVDAKFDNRYFLNQQKEDEPPPGCACQDISDLVFHFPTGFIGNPHAIPQCSVAEFALNVCSPDTQVGIVCLENSPEEEEWQRYLAEVDEPGCIVSPIYNLQPHPGKAGAVGSFAPLIELPVETQLSARTGGDYGLDATITGLFHLIAIPRLSFYLWGNPADPSHDRSRFPLPHGGLQNACQGTLRDQVKDSSDPKRPVYFGCHDLTPSSAANVPYLEAPTACGEPLTPSLDLTYYDHSQAHADTSWPATTGCDQLKFNPSLTAKPTTSAADTASGIDLDFQVPQSQSPSVPSPSELRRTTLTFPKGFSLNPGGSDGKSACLDEELNFDNELAAECPEFAKIGTSVLDSSALPGPIDGAIYIGQPLPGRRFRVFITADGFATHVKLKGEVHLDPHSGQIVSVFDNLPQSPFQDFDLHFFGSERGVFATPARCGGYAVEAEFLPWASALPAQKSIAPFEITTGPGGSPCPNPTRPFSPTFQAGTPDNTAGVTTPLSVELKRADGDQNVAGIEVELPKGLVQSIRNVTECPEAAIDGLSLASHTGLIEAAAPACPASSRIGGVVSGAGAGTKNLYNAGTVYLAGPYEKAPLSIVAVVPALGGPYDLGNVAVRAAAFVDPVTAQIRVVSDPLPQIQEGIPLRLRSLLFTFDRPGFNRTPTGCGPKSIEARMIGSEGATLSAQARFQAANCQSLPYDPHLTLNMRGGVRRRGHPAVHAVLETTPGESNLQKVSVTLPPGELLDNAHIGTVCTRVQFAQKACPAGSIYGRAEAVTPLLDQPLSGPVYLRSSSHRLPDLVVDLKGQVDLQLSGRVDAVDGRLRTTFADLPDAPVTSFTLDLLGGKKGLVINSETLCGAGKKATVKMTGQNGAVVPSKVKLDPSCRQGRADHRHPHRTAGR